MNKNGGGGQNPTIWFIVIFMIVVTMGVIVAGIMSSKSASSTNTDTSSGFVATTAPAITSTDWTEGSSTAKVSLIEYGDFQCPACGQYYPLVKQIIADYGDRVLFVFRNFPLYQVHADAGIAAQAAEAAGLQGKYWEMNNLLYEKQNEWSVVTPDAVVKKYFDGYAASLGLNVSTFDRDITSVRVMGKIQTDAAGATSAQVDHTPTFFVNLKQVQNPTSYDDFKSILDKALASS